MILVDTSIWIELLRGKRRPLITEDELLEFATCGPVAQESAARIAAWNRERGLPVRF
jgi:predicted nucleic acid-binding protein